MSIADLRARSRALAEERLCPACGAEAVEGRKLCAEHLRYQRQRKREVRAERRAAGLCLQCGAPATTSLCAEHRRAVNERARENYRAAVREKQKHKRWDADFRARRAAAGLCYRCKCPWSGRTKACPTCISGTRHHLNRLLMERKLEGLCRCGREPAQGRFSCTRCLEQQRRASARRRERQRAAGLCEACSSPRLPGSPYCATHRREYTEAKRRLVRRKAGLVLKEAA